MTRQVIIGRTIKAINQLSKKKAEEISDFADSLFKRYEDPIPTKCIQKLVSDSQTFHFLVEDKVTYSISDLKEQYHE